MSSYPSSLQNTCPSMDDQPLSQILPQTPLTHTSGIPSFSMSPPDRRTDPSVHPSGSKHAYYTCAYMYANAHIGKRNGYKLFLRNINQTNIPKHLIPYSILQDLMEQCPIKLHWLRLFSVALLLQEKYCNVLRAPLKPKELSLNTAAPVNSNTHKLHQPIPCSTQQHYR